jgi:integrase/recombinase XerD
VYIGAFFVVLKRFQKELHFVSENQYEQLSFDFEEVRNPELLTSSIDDLFTENDLKRFGKGRKGWYENDISQTKSSVLRIENPLLGNNVNEQPLHYEKDWIDKMIEQMYALDKNERRAYIEVGNVNEWVYTNIVFKLFDSSYIRKFMHNKVNVSPDVYQTIIGMFEKISPTLTRLTKKKINELSREDFLNPDYMKDLIKPLNTSQIHYYQIFLNSLKPFKQVRVKEYVEKKEKTKFNHPLVNFAERVLRKERNTQPQSFINNYYQPIQNFVKRAISVLEKFKQDSMNDFIFNKVTSEDLDDYKSFLIRKVKEGELTELTAKRNLQYVRGFFQLLFRKRKIVRDITADLTNIKADEYIFRRLPLDEEIEQLIDVIHRYSQNVLVDKIALFLMIFMGFRGIEVSKLRWEDINFSTRTVSINETKGMDAVLPIPLKLYDLLVLYKSSPNQFEYLFCDYPNSFTQHLRTIFDIYKLIARWDYGGGLHLFRHLYVTRLIKHCPPEIVKSLTRHISDDTVAKYIHLEDEFIKNELEKLSYQGGF